MTGVLLTTCRGRLHHLRRALPTWRRAFDGWRVVVVAWGCEESAEGARELGAEVIYEPGREWHKAAAWNRGLAELDRGDLVALIDADSLAYRQNIGAELEAEIAPGTFGIAATMGQFDVGGLTGFLAARVGEVRDLAGGFDERFRGWGHEDHQMRAALWGAGMRHRRVCGLWPIQHGNRERVAHQTGGLRPVEERNYRLLRSVIAEAERRRGEPFPREELIFFPRQGSRAQSRAEYARRLEIERKGGAWTR